MLWDMPTKSYLWRKHQDLLDATWFCSRGNLWWQSCFPSPTPIEQCSLETCPRSSPAVAAYTNPALRSTLLLFPPNSYEPIPGIGLCCVSGMISWPCLVTALASLCQRSWGLLAHRLLRTA